MAPKASLQFPGLANNERAFVSPHTRAGVVIYPLSSETDPFMPARPVVARAFDWRPESLASVLSLQWSKQLGQPSGQWSARIKAKTDSSGKQPIEFQKQVIRDGDWIDLAVMRNGIVIPIFRGVIDAVSEDKYSAGGATVTVYELSGRDHGAFFEYPITYASIWVQTLAEIVAGLFHHNIKGNIGGRPDQLFLWLIQGVFGSGGSAGQWQLPPGLKEITHQKTLFDLLKVLTFRASKSRAGLRGVYFNAPQLWTVGGQTLFQALTDWINPMLNEIWVDLILPSGLTPKNGMNGFLDTKSASISGDIRKDGIPVGLQTARSSGLEAEHALFSTMGAFIRERPFPSTVEGMNSAWFSLPTWILPDWLIQTSSLSYSGHQRYNLFELLADFGLGPQQEQSVIARPSWDRLDIERRGLRAYQETTRFYAASESEGGFGDWLNERLIWQRLLSDWHAPGPYLRTGSITVPVALPEVRVGQRLIVTPNDQIERGEQFYVEGVAGNYEGPQAPHNPPRCQTTFTVTRGYRGSDSELYRATSNLSARYKDVF